MTATPNSSSSSNERQVGLVRGTRDWLPADLARLKDLEARLLLSFFLAGYEPLRTPLLEFSELHERKSGAGIVARLDELADGHQGRVCLRPELTASIVRAFVEAPESPPLPWRVCMSGLVFRHQELQPGLDREFTQIGVERIGDGGASADAEVIWLADWCLRQAGLPTPSIRIGHVGLILEMLERSGLPHAVRSSLLDVISEAASAGQDVRAVETALERLSGWLLGDGPDQQAVDDPALAPADRDVSRLFRHLVPDVTGRRSSQEILARLRRKWDLGRSLKGVLARLHDQVHALATLRGPAASVVDRLQTDFRELAPDSVGELLQLVALLDDYGVDHDRIELDLGFGRGLGFYTQMIFEISVLTPDGPVEVCGGGRYDGLARVLGSNRDDRGAGFALGLERVASLLPPPAAVVEPVRTAHLIVPASPKSLPDAIRLVTLMRQNELVARLETNLTIAEACDRAREIPPLAVVVGVEGPPDNPGSLHLYHPDRPSHALPITCKTLIPARPGEEAL